MTHRAISLGIALALACHAQTKIKIEAGSVWTDTKLDVKAGETLRIAASGSLQYTGAKQAASPAGMSRGFKDMVRTLPVNAAGRGAVIARIDEGAPFLVGAKWEGEAPIDGRLWLGVNQGGNDKPEGSYEAEVTRLKAASAPVDVSKLKLPTLTQQQLDSIPRRVQDDAGTQGDRVNFIVVGSQQKMQDALKRAGWVVVDKNKKSAVAAMGLAVLTKQAYTTLPMSELKLFDRYQDFGYAMGDPVKVVAARHHFRVWKAPFTLDGATVWAGAGTHDIGFDKDQRTGGVTHKIDPDTDLEREFIAKSMKQTGLVAKVDHMTAADPITKAKTAHGEEFHSDGRTVIIYLLP